MMRIMKLVIIYSFLLTVSISLGYRYRYKSLSRSSIILYNNNNDNNDNRNIPITECELATEGTIECDFQNNINKAEIQSVWTVFGEIASQTGAINLGQGFPDWKPPQFLLDSLKETIDTPYHQYTRPAGHPPLVELLAARYSRHLNRKIDPLNEFAITVGASQALYLALTSFLKPNDEVIMFEPFFDLYLKQIKLTGAKAKFVSLGGSAATTKDPWALDINALKNAITDKTRILILNSPHNPTGKVFKLSELEAIAQIVREHPNILVLSDEVYKFTVYNPLEEGDPTSKGHYHFARLPDMWDRTITLSSCGKTFSVTGWQVGWTVGPSKYIKPIQDLLPCVQFCASTPIQHALMYALQIAEKPYDGYANYYEWMRQQFQSKRMILQEGLEAAGIEALESEGGFFLMGKLPIRPDILKAAQNSNEPYDWHFCRMLAKEYGIVAIPASPFFSSKEAANTMGPMARFAFCKLDKTLVEAKKALIAGALKYSRKLEMDSMINVEK